MQLLRCGTRLDVNARTYLGESSLSLAASKGHLRVVERLLQDRRVDPNHVDKMGRTAFWWAASAGQAETVALLLKDNRVLMQLKDENGMDALDAASRYRHFNVVLLIQGTRRSADGKAESRTTREFEVRAPKACEDPSLREPEGRSLRKIMLGHCRPMSVWPLVYCY